MASPDKNTAKDRDPVIIKKYANRRLYNTQTSVYVTLEDLEDMVRRKEDFVVTDARTGEDITRSVLTQIIFELENRGQNMLPVSFLRQLIQFYGDSMQTFVPGFLDMSLQNFVQEKERFSQQIGKVLGVPFEVYGDQVRKNMAIFEKAFEIFSPFSGGEKFAPKPDNDKDDIDSLREQMASLQKQIDRLSKKER
jgi:polyhydroxyalkanoate synthesis repressor PhaR